MGGYLKEYAIEYLSNAYKMHSWPRAIGNNIGIATPKNILTSIIVIIEE